MKHFLIFLALLPALGLRPLRAETIACTAITSVPYTITTPGIYCLKQNLTTSFPVVHAAIAINASNVVLDLNGFELEGPSFLPGAPGIRIEAGRHNNVIRNGTIRHFSVGIRLSAFDGPFISNTLIEEMLLADTPGVGILGENAVRTTIRNNRIMNTMTVAFVVPNAYGVRLLGGYGHRITNNDIVDVSGLGGGGVGRVGYGISIHSADTLVEGNRIVNVDLGIDVQDNGALLHGNWIQNATHGIYFDPASSGKYRDTLTFNVTTPYTGGTDAGGNN